MYNCKLSLVTFDEVKHTLNRRIYVHPRFKKLYLKTKCVFVAYILIVYWTNENHKDYFKRNQNCLESSFIYVKNIPSSKSNPWHV